MRQATVLADGLRFGEGPRWHDDRLWVSDFDSKVVFTVDMDGRIEPVVEVPNIPSGLGWLPDGRLLVVSMFDRKLMRLDPDGLVEHADLSGVAVGRCNDMVVDGLGRAYVGCFGFDVRAYSGYRLLGDAMRVEPETLLTDPDLPTAPLIRVDPDGSVSTAASGLRFPNGVVISPNGSTMIVAEMLDPCLTAFDMAPDGRLSNRRVWAQFEKSPPAIVPDGICVDAEGAVWVANPFTKRGNASTFDCVRVGEGGEILDSVQTSAPVYACMLGGRDRKTLFLVTNVSGETRRCQIEVTQVDVSGAGYP